MSRPAVPRYRRLATTVWHRRAGDVEITDHEIEVPLRHREPDGRTITVFAREFVSISARRRLAVGRDLPRLVYLQGGPGARAIRPPLPGWCARLLDDYAVVMLDQRGTGRSTPCTARSLGELLSRQGASGVAEYLTHFRADAIVGDAEALRTALQQDTPWTSLGQSYGGFVTLSYLSAAPAGLLECYVTGGLPDPTADARTVYEHTLTQTAATNAAYFHQWPADRAQLHRIRAHLAAHDERLPNGMRLTPRWLQMLGGKLGGRSGQDQLHALLVDAFVPGVAGAASMLSDVFLNEVGSALSFAAAPLYAVLHESIYAQGAATDWAAVEVLGRHPELAVDADPMCLLGEVTQPFFFTDDPALRPLAPVADLLAEWTDWPPLYDADRLAGNQVPEYAAVYADDMFVPRHLSLSAAGTVGSVTAWLTEDYLHDGIRDGDEVLDRLRAFAADPADARPPRSSGRRHRRVGRTD